MPIFESHSAFAFSDTHGCTSSSGHSIAHGETTSRSDTSGYGICDSYSYTNVTCGCSNPPCGACTYGAQQRVRDAIQVLLNAFVDSGSLAHFSANDWSWDERGQLLLLLLLSDLT